MSIISPQQVSDGTVADASDINNPINTIADDYNGNIDNTNIAANAAIAGSKLAANSVAGDRLSGVYAPQGFLQNGKIVTSVASNNLTVALKTLAGNDPSASDPVYARIGNSIRTITAALSVTKNAGTNWFNSGATGLATNEIDYFVYIGYNATDGVTIGFARIPYARVYGDFSATSTSDLYCAISTITSAVSTDEYEVVGRFNATLSATASFNWSIPATSIVVSRPIFETRSLAFDTNWSNLTIGNATVSSRYKITNDVVDYWIQITIGSTSSVGTDPALTLPLSSETYTTFHPIGDIICFDTSASTWYKGIVGWASGPVGRLFRYNVSGSLISIFGLTSTSPMTWATGDRIEITGSYKAAS